MLILGILVVLLLIGLSLLGHHAWDLPGFILSLISGVCLITGLIMLPMQHYDTKANIEQFKITKITYKNARLEKVSVMERAAIQMDIANQNRWLAERQYFNETIFDIWIPDAVMDLKPLQ